MVRSRRHFAMLCSPFLVLYAITLCSLQYVWAMDLSPELPTRISFMRLQPLGLVHPSYPCLTLGAKVSVALSQPCPHQRPAGPAHRLSPQLLLTLTFWMLLRQFVKEKVLARRSPATPLLEVSVTDTGEGSWCHPRCARLSTPQLGGGSRCPPPGSCSPSVPHRHQPDEGCAEEPGGGSEEFLCQVLDLRLRRDVHRGDLHRPPRRLQDRLHAPLPPLPHPVPGRGAGDPWGPVPCPGWPC